MAASFIYDSPKRFCIHGHDTHDVGRRVGNGSCLSCEKLHRKKNRRSGVFFDSKVRFCPQGHDTHEVGRKGANSCCVACENAYRRSVYKRGAYYDGQVQFCPRGHDTHEVGRRVSTKCCIECERENQARYRERRKGTIDYASQKRWCIHGHDTWVEGRTPAAMCRKCVSIAALARLKSQNGNPRESWRFPRLKQVRLSLGLTQEEFGKRCGISGRFICDLEAGKYGTAPIRAARIFKFVAEEMARISWEDAA